MGNSSSQITNKTKHLNALSRQHSDELSKYTYFILAVAGAAIAYALKAAEEKTDAWLLFCLFFAVVLWAASFAFGIKNLSNFRAHLSVNAQCILRDFTDEQMLKALEPYEKGAERASRYQLIFLVAGALAYAASQVVSVFLAIVECNA